VIASATSHISLCGSRIYYSCKIKYCTAIFTFRETYPFFWKDSIAGHNRIVTIWDIGSKIIRQNREFHN